MINVVSSDYCRTSIVYNTCPSLQPPLKLVIDKPNAIQYIQYTLREYLEPELKKYTLLGISGDSFRDDFFLPELKMKTILGILNIFTF